MLYFKRLTIGTVLLVSQLFNACTNKECSSNEGSDFVYSIDQPEAYNFDPIIVNSGLLSKDTIGVERVSGVNLIHDIKGTYNPQTNEFDGKKLQINLEFATVSNYNFGQPERFADYFEYIKLILGTNNPSIQDQLIVAEYFFSEADSNAYNFNMEIRPTFKSDFSSMFQYLVSSNYYFYFIGKYKKYPTLKKEITYRLNFSYSLTYNGPCKYKQ